MPTFDELWDELDSGQSSSSSSSNFEELWSQLDKPKQAEGSSFLDQASNAAISAASGLIGSPKALLQLPESLSKQAFALIRGRDPEREDYETKGRQALDLLEKLSSFLPDASDVRSKFIDEDPNLVEKIAMGAGSGLPFGGIGALVGGGGALLEEGLQSIDASPRVKAASHLTLAATAGLKSKGLRPKKGQKPMMDLLKKAGMTDEQIAPILNNPNIKTATLSKLASNGKKTQAILEATQKGFEPVYDLIRENPESARVLSPEKAVELQRTLDNSMKDLPTKFKKDIKVDMEDYFNSARDFNDTTSLIKKINQTFGGKSTDALRLKKSLNEALETMSPSLAKEFNLAQEAYSKFANLREELNPSVVNKFVPEAVFQYAKGAGTLAGIVVNPLLTAKIIGSKMAAGTLARHLLLNPKLKNINQRFVYALNKRSLGMAQKVQKEMADEWEKIDPEVAKVIRESDISELIKS